MLSQVSLSLPKWSMQGLSLLVYNEDHEARFSLLLLFQQVWKNLYLCDSLFLAFYMCVCVCSSAQIWQPNQSQKKKKVTLITNESYSQLRFGGLKSIGRGGVRGCMEGVEGSCK